MPYGNAAGRGHQGTGQQRTGLSRSASVTGGENANAAAKGNTLLKKES